MSAPLTDTGLSVRSSVYDDRRRPELTTLNVPGATLYYEIEGTGPVLLMIPGGPADAGIFAGLASFLTDRYTVVAYDPRGNSRSMPDDPSKDQDLDVHGDDAAALLAAVASEPAYVLGSSGGAQIGLNLAARHPARVRTLVAHEPPCTEMLPDPAEVRAAMEEVYQTYRTQGVEAGMKRFEVVIGMDGTQQEQPQAEESPHIAEHSCIVDAGSDPPTCSPSIWGCSTSTSRSTSPPNSSSSSARWPTGTVARPPGRTQLAPDAAVRASPMPSPGTRDRRGPHSALGRRVRCPARSVREARLGGAGHCRHVPSDPDGAARDHGGSGRDTADKGQACQPAREPQAKQRVQTEPSGTGRPERRGGGHVGEGQLESSLGGERALAAVSGGARHGHRCGERDRAERVCQPRGRQQAAGELGGRRERRHRPARRQPDPVEAVGGRLQAAPAEGAEQLLGAVCGQVAPKG